ncbi:hypothetical protein C8R42DRAFT_763143 [Lentinula raphanica]|nr:hypothetical protein C8R42DRAFT_763143 [Lentinula raphanica]
MPETESSIDRGCKQVHNKSLHHQRRVQAVLRARADTIRWRKLLNSPASPCKNPPFDPSVSFFLSKSHISSNEADEGNGEQMGQKEEELGVKKDRDVKDESGLVGDRCCGLRRRSVWRSTQRECVLMFTEWRREGQQKRRKNGKRKHYLKILHVIRRFTLLLLLLLLPVLEFNVILLPSEYPISPQSSNPPNVIYPISDQDSPLPLQARRGVEVEESAIVTTDDENLVRKNEKKFKRTRRRCHDRDGGTPKGKVRGTKTMTPVIESSSDNRPREEGNGCTKREHGNEL